jgi:hypothetical protein
MKSIGTAMTVNAQGDNQVITGSVAHAMTRPEVMSLGHRFLRHVQCAAEYAVKLFNPA